MKVVFEGHEIKFTQDDADLLLESLTVVGVAKYDSGCPLCLKYGNRCKKCPLGGSWLCDGVGSDITADIEDARLAVEDRLPNSTRKLQNIRRRVRRILAKATD